MCETPKSPPGDYNYCKRYSGLWYKRVCVKHLNPRQGITTHLWSPKSQSGRGVCETPKSPPGDYNRVASPNCYDYNDCSVKHLNPRQGITTTSAASTSIRASRCDFRVKHLNPRQGITTFNLRRSPNATSASGVKHLNPRQGITTIPGPSFPSQGSSEV